MIDPTFLAQSLGLQVSSSSKPEPQTQQWTQEAAKWEQFAYLVKRAEVGLKNEGSRNGTAGDLNEFMRLYGEQLIDVWGKLTDVPNAKGEEGEEHCTALIFLLVKTHSSAYYYDYWRKHAADPARSIQILTLLMKRLSASFPLEVDDLLRCINTFSPLLLILSYTLTPLCSLPSYNPLFTIPLAASLISKSNALTRAYNSEYHIAIHQNTVVEEVIQHVMWFGMMLCAPQGAGQVAQMRREGDRKEGEGWFDSFKA